MNLCRNKFLTEGEQTPPQRCRVLPKHGPLPSCRAFGIPQTHWDFRGHRPATPTEPSQMPLAKNPHTQSRWLLGLLCPTTPTLHGRTDHALHSFNQKKWPEGSGGAKTCPCVENSLERQV